MRLGPLDKSSDLVFHLKASEEEVASLRSLFRFSYSVISSSRKAVYVSFIEADLEVAKNSPLDPFFSDMCSLVISDGSLPQKVFETVPEGAVNMPPNSLGVMDLDPLIEAVDFATMT